MPEKNTTSALTKQEDWEKYHSSRQIASLEAAAQRPSTVPMVEEYLNNRSGGIFELGCGGSGAIARSAELGWKVGGIDFNAAALDYLKDYLSNNQHPTEDILLGDIYDFDCNRLKQKYDLLASFGFFEHFKDPTSILKKWKTVIKDDGLVLCVIPNLFSINAYFMKKFDRDFWNQHIPYTPEQIDQFHIDAGLVPLEKARYIGSYSSHMLIPWNKIAKLVGNKPLFKFLKKLTKLLIQKPLNLFPSRNMRRLNSYIVGIYQLTEKNTRSLSS